MASFAFIFALLFAVLFTLSLASSRNECPAARACLAALDSGKKCPLIRMPPQELPAPVPAEGFRLAKLRPGVWSVFEAGYVNMILFKNNRLAVIDFPKTSVKLPNAVLRVLKGKRPSSIDMVYSHRHADHIGGAAKFRSFLRSKFPGVPVRVWGTRMTKRFMRREGRLPIPNVIVGKRGRTLNMAQSLRIRFKILGGHTLDDLVSHVLPSRDGAGIIQFVDLLNPGFAPINRFGLTQDFKKYIKVHDELLKLNFKTFVPGHTRLGTAEDIALNKRIALSVIKAARTAVKKVTGADLAAAGIGLANQPGTPQFGNAYFALDLIMRLQTAVCFRDVVEKWGCKLAGVDISGESLCRTALFSILVDG